MSSKSIKVKVKTQPPVIMEAEVARKIRQHARTSMKAEVCGVLLGTAETDRTVVDACIAGINAAQGGAHVTFTQDTWEHIYKIKDQQFPDARIVGWYHSHPGFGVFLSEHDLFIQENFFSNPQQVAWVYDPHTDEEGCFGWVSGKIAKLSSLSFGYSHSVEVGGSAPVDYEDQGDDDAAAPMVHRPSERLNAEPAWVTWTTRALMAISLLALGCVAGLFFWRLSPWARNELRPIVEGIKQQEQRDQLLVQQCEPELRACETRVLHLTPPPLSPAAPGTAAQNPQPSGQSQPNGPRGQKAQPDHGKQPEPKTPAGAGKGSNGK
jgi:proteasome lid subunit RPN8/RPN11